MLVTLSFGPGRNPGDLVSRLDGGKVVLIERGARLPAGFPEGKWECEVTEREKVAIARPLRAYDPKKNPPKIPVFRIKAMVGADGRVCWWSTPHGPGRLDGANSLPGLRSYRAPVPAGMYWITPSKIAEPVWQEGSGQPWDPSGWRQAEITEFVWERVESISPSEIGEWGHYEHMVLNPFGCHIASPEKYVLDTAGVWHRSDESELLALHARWTDGENVADLLLAKGARLGVMPSSGKHDNAQMIALPSTLAKLFPFGVPTNSGLQTVKRQMKWTSLWEADTEVSLLIVRIGDNEIVLGYHSGKGAKVVAEYKSWLDSFPASTSSIALSPWWLGGSDDYHSGLNDPNS